MLTCRSHSPRHPGKSVILHRLPRAAHEMRMMRCSHPCLWAQHCMRRSNVDLVLGTGDRAAAPGEQSACTAISVKMENWQSEDLRTAGLRSSAARKASKQHRKHIGPSELQLIKSEGILTQARCSKSPGAALDSNDGMFELNPG
mmetsp:Transcript_13311/g.31761  ORF Transcript_13311/g.31761 Transcript_13311/m.31761 type:complete len:144 (+) Transcript_13311:514-945(+)